MNDNSGSWSGRQFDFVDNITSAIMPTNNDTITILYNQRFMITDPRRPIPLVWTVSKIEDSTPFGLTEFKFTQETYSPTVDNKELMLCNYYDSPIQPETPDPQTELRKPAAIAYTGTTPTLKVGGSFKTFTAVFSDASVTVDKWLISNADGAITAEMQDYIVEYDNDKLKLKIARNYNLIGQVIIVQAIGTDGSAAETQMEVIG